MTRRAPEPTLQNQVEEEVERVVVAGRQYAFRPEPRCRVCQHPEVSALVNRMLALGRSYAQITRQVAIDIEDLSEEERPSYSSVYTHAKRHFANDSAAQAVYREILERRAVEADRDFIRGLGNALTPLAYLETVMLKGYEVMVAQGTNIDPETGMKAAEKLHAITATQADELESARLMGQMNQIIEAVRSVVPMEYWAKIVERLEGMQDVVIQTESDGTPAID